MQKWILNPSNAAVLRVAENYKQASCPTAEDRDTKLLSESLEEHTVELFEKMWSCVHELEKMHIV